jgi:hypothetical protein
MLSPAEFRHTLEMGFGRALRHLQTHDAAPYKTIILEACLRDTAYDVQIDGSRAAYLMDAIHLADIVSLCKTKIISALPNSIGDSRLYAQLTEFTLAFAKLGFTDAREALYQQFLRSIQSDVENPECVDEIVELDGNDGLYFVLEEVGKLLTLETNVDFLTRLISEKRSPELEEAFTQWCNNSPTIEKIIHVVDFYWSELRKKQASHEKKVQNQKLTYDNVRKQSKQEDSPLRGLMRIWAHQASEADVKNMALELLELERVERLIGYLTFFSIHPFPLEPSVILKHFQHPNKDVSWGAARALQLVQHSSVREFALKYAGNSSCELPKVIGFLVLNYQSGDAPMIANWLLQDWDEHWFHQLGSDALDVAAANPLPELGQVLEIVYQKGRCLHCRQKAVRLLEQIGVLPQAILEECVFDASSEIREWAREKLNAKPM